MTARRTAWLPGNQFDSAQCHSAEHVEQSFGRIDEEHIGIGVTSLETEIHSPSLCPGAMHHAGRDGEGISGPKTKAAAVAKVDLQLSLKDHEALRRTWMLVPAELALHHRHSDTVVIYVERDEVLVVLLH